MHVEALQSKNTSVFSFSCNLKRYFYYYGLSIEYLSTEITAFSSVETVTTGRTAWLCVSVYCVLPALRTGFIYNR